STLLRHLPCTIRRQAREPIAHHGNRNLVSSALEAVGFSQRRMSHVSIIVRAIAYSTASIIRRHRPRTYWRHEQTMNALVAMLRHIFIHPAKSARGVAMTATQGGATSNTLRGQIAIKTEVPEDVTVKPAPLSREQRRWLDDALALVDEERMRAFNHAITAIHSPTGEERTINEGLARNRREVGLQPFCQPLHETARNAVGRLSDRGAVPTL